MEDQELKDLSNHVCHQEPNELFSNSNPSKDTENSILKGETNHISNHIENDVTKPLTGTVSNTDEIGDDIKCGLAGCRPEWMQIFASKKVYVFIYGFLGMSQSAIAAYFIGTISTIEKRFKLPSTTTGIISSSWDIGAMSTAMIMAYYGSAGHKTRWVAVAGILAALSCYMRYLPHFIFGPGVDANNFSNETTPVLEGNLCVNGTGPSENCSLNSEGMIAFLLLTLAHFVLGIGTSSYYTLGAAYMDDNVLKNKFPFLFALATCIRYFGPTLGYLGASYTLSLFVDQTMKPSYGQDDPRWIGAWYMGWIPFGTWHIILAILMLFFPKMLPREATRRKNVGAPVKQPKQKKSIKDFKQTLIRLMKNPILMLNTLSSTFYIFGMMGYWIFMPKYIETQFRKTASQASLITGVVGLICTALGVMASGSFVSKFKPRPKYLAAWNVFTETIDIFGHIIYAYLGCYKDDLAGAYNPDGSWNLAQQCNSDCNCGSSTSYSPVCSQDLSTTYYSPCHAGCSDFSIVNATKEYMNCTCIGGGIALEGPCPVECNSHFIIFLSLMCFMKFLSATGRSGNVIIQLRSVAPEDKSISIAFAEVVVCAFAYIPAPIMYGMLLDSSCLVWGMICGKPGNCWLYHGQKLRYLLNFTASSFLVISTLLDVGVLCKVGSLKIYDEDMSLSKNDKQDGTTATTEGTEKEK